MQRLANLVTWGEVGESRQSAVGSFAADAGSLSMDVICNWTDLNKVITNIVGYSWVDFFEGEPRLNRYAPAAHPYWPAFRATRINSVFGIGPIGVTTLGDSVPALWNNFTHYVIGQTVLSHGIAYTCNANNFNEEPPNPAFWLVDLNPVVGGYAGQWQKARLSIQFEVTKYPVVSDVIGLTGEAYRAFTEWSFSPNIEQLARKGTNWTWLGIDPGAANSFTGDTYLRVPKGILQARWIGVPENWVMDGRVFPTNLMKAVGKLNDRPFPSVGWPSTRDATINVQFPAGTLLMLPPAMTASAMLTGSNAGGILDVFESSDNNTYRPRALDVILKWVYFNPPYDPANYSNVNIKVDGVVTLVKIIGHNLLPLPYPRLGVDGVTYYSWYPAVKNANPLVAITTPLATDEDLQYQYTSMEDIWDCVNNP
jgi:hypothetical protein